MRTNMAIVFCLIGKAQRFANCKVCVCFTLLFYSVCFTNVLVDSCGAVTPWCMRAAIPENEIYFWALKLQSVKKDFISWKKPKKTKEGLMRCHTCLMTSRYLENKRRVLTCVTSYLFCSFPLWFLLYFQDKQSPRQRNLMQLGWALLWCSTQISPSSPEVAGVWHRIEGEGDKGGDEGRAEKKGREKKMRQEQSDEVLKLWESRYLELWRDVMMIFRMWERHFPFVF